MRGILAALVAALVIALVCAPALLIGCGVERPVLPKGSAPNILLVVVDDLGWGDVGSYGSPDAHTPRLDELAAQGVRATDFYVSSPICSTSRASLLTGRSPRRHGLDWSIVGTENEQALDDDELLLAGILGQAGYVTGLVGKWHLGATKGHRPTERGFDEFFGMLRASSGYYEHSYRGQPDLWNGTEPIQRNGAYSTDLYSDEAIAFMDRHADQPWFLCLSYNAPHLADDRRSLPAPEDATARFADTELPERRRQYLAVVAALDAAIGRVLDALDASGQADDTLVLLLSDNGPAFTSGGTAAPFSRGKDTLDEGGIRVPFLARWPGHVPAGAVCSEIIAAVDVLPTALTAAGVALPLGLAIDGHDILPILAGTASSPHESLFWDHTSRFIAADGKPIHEQVVRRDHWRLTRTHDGALVLHDLQADPGQTEDVSEAHPSVTADLRARLDAATDSR